jgi:hypothetical protein
MTGKKDALHARKPSMDVDETLGWLRDENRAVMKAASMRIEEATHIATEYARGRTSTAEMNEQIEQYQAKWRGGINHVPGVRVTPGEEVEKDDAEFVKRLAERRGARTSRQLP